MGVLVVAWAFVGARFQCFVIVIVSVWVLLLMLFNAFLVLPKISCKVMGAYFNRRCIFYSYVVFLSGFKLFYHVFSDF